MGVGGVILVCMGLLRRRGHGYHSMFGVFTGCSVLGTSLVLILSSTVFAGIRRTTGLTFRNAWPIISHTRSTQWLRWYDSRLADLTARADLHVQTIISRHSSSITDPNIRRVWERQLRDDAHRKLERIKSRREYCVRLMEQTGMDGRKRRRLAVYLQVGEWVMDKVIEWMRNSKVFVEEPRNELDVNDVFGSDDMFDGEVASVSRAMAEPSAPELSSSQIMDLGSFASTSRPHVDSNPPPYSPIDQAKPLLDTNLLL
ncbi:hypothetical protein IW139_004706 [Coemansia sp. RSA 353]|nr:hypothetical protein IW144_000553 [Coemansia sp. RSA 522]KAJ2273721.1 hypothetical protein J3F81_002543 [Coemansia sp. RSA 371]KAJ2291252.1 hypothetical protein IW139_004706 [Coemansia sp. RSA 353]KAJ2292759.1 hypothetical protein IW141_001683 [Coemansia sp. RSA 355]KAJ2433566.1 hypothetical protein IWW41_001990 [Coemansia sp. RSA 2522]